MRMAKAGGIREKFFHFWVRAGCTIPRSCQKLPGNSPSTKATITAVVVRDAETVRLPLVRVVADDSCDARTPP